MVPGFTLFRRTSSRVSNPTAQGITLRGLGGTGASRSLVLADGMPLNDAFGGWVYWDKLPQAAIDRIEVLRGSGSDSVRRGRGGRRGADPDVAPDAPRDALAHHRRRKPGHGPRVAVRRRPRTRGWSYTAGGEWFNTDGYIAVAERAGSRHQPARPDRHESRVEHDSATGLRSAIRLATAGVSTSAATCSPRIGRTARPPSINDTASRQGTGEVAGGIGERAVVDARPSAARRATTRRSRRCPPTARAKTSIACSTCRPRTTGTGAQWMRPFGRHDVVVGAEGRFIKGSTREAQLSAGRVVATLDNGGTQHDLVRVRPGHVSGQRSVDVVAALPTVTAGTPTRRTRTTTRRSARSIRGHRLPIA